MSQFANPAADVMLDMAHLCHKAVREERMNEAKRISDLIVALGDMFPKAEAELNDRYPGMSEEG